MDLDTGRRLRLADWVNEWVLTLTKYYYYYYCCATFYIIPFYVVRISTIKSTQHFNQCYIGAAAAQWKWQAGRPAVSSRCRIYGSRKFINKCEYERCTIGLSIVDCEEREAGRGRYKNELRTFNRCVRVIKNDFSFLICRPRIFFACRPFTSSDDNAIHFLLRSFNYYIGVRAKCFATPINTILAQPPPQVHAWTEPFGKQPNLTTMKWHINSVTSCVLFMKFRAQRKIGTHTHTLPQSITSNQFLFVVVRNR